MLDSVIINHSNLCDVVDVAQCPVLEYISIDRRNAYDGVLRLTREQDVHLKVQGFGDLEIVY